MGELISVIAKKALVTLIICLLVGLVAWATNKDFATILAVTAVFLAVTVWVDDEDDIKNDER